MACCMTAATDTHSEYVTPIGGPVQFWLHDTLRHHVYKHIACVAWNSHRLRHTGRTLERFLNFLSVAGWAGRVRFKKWSAFDCCETAGCIARLKRDGTCAGTRFGLSTKQTSPFKSAGASVQSTAGSRGVRISGSNAGYTVFWGRVQDYWLSTPLASFPFTSPTVRHRVPSGFNWAITPNSVWEWNPQVLNCLINNQQPAASRIFAPVMIHRCLYWSNIM